MSGTLKYEIDFRQHMSRFDFPSMEKVSKKLDKVFRNQEFVLQALKGPLLGVYCIFPENDVDLNAIPPLMFPTHKRFSDDIVEVEVDIRKVTYVKKR